VPSARYSTAPERLGPSSALSSDPAGPGDTEYVLLGDISMGWLERPSLFTAEGPASAAAAASALSVRDEEESGACMPGSTATRRDLGGGGMGRLVTGVENRADDVPALCVFGGAGCPAVLPAPAVADAADDDITGAAGLCSYRGAVW